MSAPRVIFVNRFYWPEEPATAQLLTDLAEGLARSGKTVTVITRLPPGSTELTEHHEGVDIVRIPASTLGKHSLAGRALDFLSFLRGARRQLKQLVNAGDTVVSLTDPPMLGAALDGVVRARGARCIQWVQDIFPEVAAEVSGRSAIRLLAPWRNRAWRHAYACVAPGHDMAEFLIRQGVPLERVSVCQNWAPAGVAPAAQNSWKDQHGLAEKFVVMYSGNLGRVHNFTSIVPLARRLAADPRIQLVFVGSGAQRAALESRVAAERLENVTFLPAQPRAALSQVLSAGDLHLVTLRAGCEDLVFPSKLYGIAAVGRPVVVIGPGGCEPARLVTEHGFGCGFAAEQVDEIAAYILKLARDPSLRETLGASALAFNERLGGSAAAVEHWSRVLQGETRPKAACRPTRAKSDSLHPR